MTHFRNILVVVLFLVFSANYYCTANHTMSINQEQLHAAFLSGDEKVLAALYSEGFAPVKRFVINNSGGIDDARDVFQDAMTIVWLNIQQGKFKVLNDASLQGYLFQIAKYKWLDKLKSKESKVTRSLKHEGDHIPDNYAVEDETQFHYLQKLYAGLGEKCKRILDLFYYENKSLDEIGADLGFDADSLRTMKYRCMMQLRKFHHEEQQKS
jgi:RNA polymerase sigma factor (sigma-70 family)